MTWAAIGGAAIATVGSVVSSRNQSKAINRAAGAQTGSIDRGIAEVDRSTDVARQDLAPFAQAGRDAVDPLMALILGDTEFKDDPYISNVLGEATRRLFANRVAGNTSGLGAGQTIEDLVNTTFLVGDQRVNQLMNLINSGQNAALGQATAASNRGSQISNLLTGRGDALASASIAGGNARSDNIQNLTDIGFRLFGQRGGNGSSSLPSGLPDPRNTRNPVPYTPGQTTIRGFP